MALKGSCPTLKKIADDEEMFVLRAQDSSAPHAVTMWIADNIYSAPPEKLREALDCALRMRVFHRLKAAD